MKKIIHIIFWVTLGSIIVFVYSAQATEYIIAESPSQDLKCSVRYSNSQPWQSFTPEFDSIMTGFTFNALKKVYIPIGILDIFFYPGDPSTTDYIYKIYFDTDTMTPETRLDYYTATDPVTLEANHEYYITFQLEEGNTDVLDVYATYDDLYEVGYQVGCSDPDASDIGFKVHGYHKPIQPFYLDPFLNTVYASTNCNFVTTGSTTTAECTDPVITNTTQDIATGLFLFFVTFFGLLFYFKPKGGD